MRDLEDKLRELLDQRAEDAISQAAGGMADEVRARMRRRQALTTTLGGLTLAAIVSLSVLGTRAVLKPETTGQPLGPRGLPFAVFDPPIPVQEGQFRLASGDASGETWNLLVQRDERPQGGIALEVHTSDGDISGAGGFTVPKERDIETSSAWVGTNSNEQIIFGAVVTEAADFYFESKEGPTTRGAVISLPESLQPTFDVILIQVSRQVEGDIVITDEEGEGIVREQLFPGPIPPPTPLLAPTPPIVPGEPIPLVDHFGNTVGFVPWEQAFGEPSQKPPGPPGSSGRPVSPGALEGFAWAPPGLQVPEVTVEEVRATARISLVRIWTAVTSWWENRPKPASSDSAFLRWWASYPIGTEPVPEVSEITPQG